MLIRKPHWRAVVLLLLPSIGGCAWVRSPSGPGMNDEELATVRQPDTVRIEVSADTTFADPEIVDPPKPRPRETSRPVPAAPAETTTDTVEAPRVDISVQMSESERLALEEGARDRISRTREILGAIDSSGFNQAKRDALITIEGLIASAGNALDQGDLQAADSLARKALLLATDLAPK